MARDLIQEEAARWFTRLQGAELPVEETVEWQRWMALDPRHAEAFQRLEEVWLTFAVLPRPALLAREAVERDRYDGSVPISEWNSKNARARTQRRSIVFTLAASILVAVIGSVFMWAQRWAAVETLETRVGENRTVTLADGSRLVMGGRTRVAIRIGATRRELDLLQGEALFSVAKDPARPFQVMAGSASVTALGTEFNVRRSKDRVVVAVLEGRVMVQPVLAMVPVPWIEDIGPTRARGDGQSVDAGHRAIVDRAGIGATVSVPDASEVTAWQRGQLSFDDEPLRYVVEAVNRYSDKRIVIVDPQIEDVRVSGTVLGEHISGWVVSLDAAFGIRAVEDGESIRLERRAGEQ